MVRVPGVCAVGERNGSVYEINEDRLEMKGTALARTSSFVGKGRGREAAERAAAAATRCLREASVFAECQNHLFPPHHSVLYYPSMCVGESRETRRKS